MRPRAAAAVLALAALWLGAAPAPAAARVVDGVVAVVNGEPLTFSEVRDVAAESLGIPVADADGYLREEREAPRVLRFIEALVESALVRQELQALGQPVRDQEIDRAVENIRNNNRLTQEQFVEALARDGQSLEAYRRRLRWQMERASIVRAKKAREITVTDDEVKAAFREGGDRFLVGAEVRLDTLHIPVPAGPAEEANVKLRIATQRAAELLRGGKTPAQAAALLGPSVPGASVVSSDFIRTDDLAPEIQREVRRLATGETSQPFFTESGGHVVTVAARRGGTLPELSAVRESIDEDLTDRRSEKAYVDILSELKRNASVDVHL